MPTNLVAENAFGYLGTCVIFWMIQLIPQIWKSYRTQSTDGYSHWLALLWAVAAPFLGAYAVVQNLNVPLIVQPQVFCALSLVSWGQCQYYSHKRSKVLAAAMTLGVGVLLGGLEVGLIFAVKSVYHDGVGNTRALDFVGIMASVLISIALFPQYYEIWKHQEVIGISVLFMVVDLLGGVWSDLSLVFKGGKLDVIAATSYSLVVALDAVVIICAMVLNPRANRRRSREAAAVRDEEEKGSQRTDVETDA
ncbi:hypothetical protein FIBSPDRAFT_741378 [Athelia psychrophila]|uniref:PQ-loop-domain-containing protein n=1 Tax=Athelia psychrophila TaxID=1759441 RepID=A0A166JN78_9AGAM|nr:hypothetical protein FIBSPDRAFT_741378 [Fibularhizoctonia sp. CBS 109695]